MRHRLTILTSLLLLAAFSTFTVATPVYAYLCPMMSAENPVCDLWGPPTGEGDSITNLVPSCCAKVLVVDRDTTPFLKTSDGINSWEHAVAISVLTPDETHETRLTRNYQVLDQATRHSPPIFLLDSSLLL